MSTYAIEAVHRNQYNGKIEQVMWARVDPDNNAWETDPTVATVDEVIACLNDGDDVWTAFPVGKMTVLGPKVEVVQEAEAANPLGVSIETVDAEVHPGRTLIDMPLF